MILPFLLAFLATFLLIPLSLSLLKKFGILDNPSRNHPAIIHIKPTPRGGGIPLFLGILIASLFYFPLTSFTIALFSSAFLALVVGVLDDKLDISPYIRFVANIISALIVVVNGVSIPFVTNPLQGGIFHITMLEIPFLPQAIAIVWIVWVMNMLNWSKGVDGQMPGVVAIAAFIIGILSLRFPVTDLNSLIAAKLPFMIAGSSLAFLLFNFYPAKIFPGYGATSLYFLLAVVSILSGVKLATAILVMGIPMVDGIFTIGRRIFSKRSPFWHDKKHLHHLLLQLGFGQRRIALFYWIVSAIVGVISLTLSSRGKLFAILLIIVLIGGAILFLHKFLKGHNET